METHETHETFKDKDWLYSDMYPGGCLIQFKGFSKEGSLTGVKYYEFFDMDLTHSGPRHLFNNEIYNASWFASFKIATPEQISRMQREIKLYKFQNDIISNFTSNLISFKPSNKFIEMPLNEKIEEVDKAIKKLEEMKSDLRFFLQKSP